MCLSTHLTTRFVVYEYRHNIAMHLLGKDHDKNVKAAIEKKCFGLEIKGAHNSKTLLF